MTVESVTHISDLNASNPALDDPKAEGDDHIRNIKTALLTDLPNITGPITATQAELNVLDGITATTAEINVLDGVTATTAELNRVIGGLNTKVIDIGDWNMNTAASINVAHGLTLSKIRTVRVIIRNDGDTAIYPLEYSPAGTTPAGSCYVGAIDVALARATSGYFDNTTYDSTSFNRGWITIQYTD